MKKYAVYVTPFLESGWTESVEDTREEAEERAKFIEAFMRGVRTEIQEFDDD